MGGGGWILTPELDESAVDLHRMQEGSNLSFSHADCFYGNAQLSAEEKIRLFAYVGRCQSLKDLKDPTVIKELHAQASKARAVPM